MKTLKISIIALVMVFAVTFAKAQVHVSVGFGVPVYHPYYGPVYYGPRYYNSGYYVRPAYHPYYHPYYRGRVVYRGRRW